MGQGCCGNSQKDELGDIQQNQKPVQKGQDDNAAYGGDPLTVSQSTNNTTVGKSMEDDEERDTVDDLVNPGKKISHSDFQTVKVVGRGSFGKVYLVKKKSDGKPYAMKILKKDQLIKKNLLIKTQAERDILQKVKNPYIVGLHYAFQTETKLYFIIDFLNGGELFTYLRKDSKFSETRARIYCAEIIEAIDCLHKQGIIYRDLKPENVLLDSEGHIRITDFGLSKQYMEPGMKTKSFCGTPEYLAPEIITADGHWSAVDWWSLGALLYEMLCGRPPHYNRDRQLMLKNIVEIPISMKSYFSPEASSLLTGLLERDPTKRIGCNPARGGANELRNHPFFSEINWDDIRERKHETVYKPKVKGPEDTSCIDTLFTKEGLQETYINPNVLTSQQKEAAHFDQFTYQEDNALKK